MANIKIEELRPMSANNNIADLTEAELGVTGGLLDILNGNNILNDVIDVKLEDNGGTYNHYNGDNKYGSWKKH